MSLARIVRSTASRTPQVCAARTASASAAQTAHVSALLRRLQLAQARSTITQRAGTNVFAKFAAPFASRRAFSTASSATGAASGQAESAQQPQQLFAEAQAALQEAQAAVSSAARGSEAHIGALCHLGKVHLSVGQVGLAEASLREALTHQQALFEANVSPATFHASVSLLTQLVTCMRMSGINPADQSNLDAVVDAIYTKGLKAKLVAAMATSAPKELVDALEDTRVYTLLAFAVGAYIDGEAFSKAKSVIQAHLLFDYPASAPSDVEGTYELRDLRLATGLNFLGMALWHDHSACGGGGHANHHHVHDHSAAEKSWEAGLAYTRPFTKLIEDGQSVNQLDDTDLLFLQATTILLDNLAQAKMSSGDLEGAVKYSEQVVLQLSRAFPDLHHELIAGQAQLLKTLLEAQRMDDAEMLCETMLKSFPRPSRTPDPHPTAEQLTQAVPHTVTLDTARVLDDLSNVMFQFGNPEYAEKFLQLSLLVLQARLRGQPGVEGAQAIPAGDHPAVARAFNGLGTLQIQMRDFAAAEANLREGLRMRLQTGAPNASNLHLSADSAAAASLPADGGLAEFYHNLGVAQLGQNAAAAAGSAEDAVVQQARSEEALANLLQAQAQYDVRYRDSTDPTGKTINKVQPSYAALMSQLAQLYKVRGSDEQALQFSQEALAIKQQLFKPTSRELVGDLYLTAFLLSTRFGRHAEAVPLYKQLVTIVSQPEGARPPNPVNLGVALHWHALALDKSGEPALAADAWRKALVQMETCMGPRELIPVQKELLRVLTQIGLDDEAKQVDGKIKANETKLQQQMQEKEREATQKQSAEAAAAAAPQSNEGASFSEASA
jgi:hypothetical protein